ncbi:MAG: hypothetical protein AB1Z29_24180 [Desulfobacterales bacterium]|jgi:hypothetical protein
MFYFKRSSRSLSSAVSALVGIAFGLVIHTPVAQAETPYDITNCYYGKLTKLYDDKELTILTTDVRGIARSNHENKVFDNCSFHSVQIIQTINDKVTRSGHTKFLDPDGDYFFVEVSGGKAATVKFLYGTGKWKGITGTGKFERLARGKSMEPDTFQGCVRNTGMFELPEKP